MALALPLAAMTIFVYFLGKPRDAHLNALAAEYLKRARRYGNLEMQEIKPDKPSPAARHPRARFLLLDPTGATINSSHFKELIESASLAAQDLVFAVGGADGYPPSWDLSGAARLSLSPLTLPHELARLILLEQIYRALATLHGHPYAH